MNLSILKWRFLIAMLFALQIIRAQEIKTTISQFNSIQINNNHPRIWVDANKIIWLKSKCKGKSVEQVKQLTGNHFVGLALTYLITGDEKTGRTAIANALEKYTNSGSIHFDLDSPDGENKRVHFQSILADRALVYDWCYPLLTANDKAEFIKLMVPDMKKHIGFKRAWRSFHNGLYDNAWPTVAGILALEGDESYTKEAWEFVKPELVDVLKTFENVFPDGEWPEGMDYNRHSTYPAIKLFLAIKTATGTNFLADSKHIKNTGKYIIYGSKASGLNLPADDNDWPYIGSWERTALLMLNEEYKDGYIQNILNNCPAPRFQLEDKDKYQDLLWYNPATKEKPLTELPFSRIFRGKGLVIARSNWDWDQPNKPANSTWLSFQCGDYMGDHAHYDVNSFAITHNGELALDAGRYDSDWGIEDWNYQKDTTLISKSQFFNYYQRTIAHNTILVKDPNEKMGLHVLNDGGQVHQLRVKGPRNVPEDYDQGNFPSEDGIGKCDWGTNPGRWETGDITSYKATNDFMYVRGDGSKAYSSDKMKSYIRQLVYLQPNIIVVMDKVVSTNPDFKKTWLLHSVNEPKIDSKSNNIEIIEGNGRLVCVPVLLHKLKIEKIGGPGNEFLVDGVQFQCGMKGKINPQPLHYGEIPGAWRIEESPALPSSEDFFLNVMLTTDKNSTAVPEVKILSESTNEIAIEVAFGQIVSILKFSKGKNPSASIKILQDKIVIVEEKMPNAIELEKGREN